MTKDTVLRATSLALLKVSTLNLWTLIYLQKHGELHMGPCYYTTNNMYDCDDNLLMATTAP